MSATLGFKIEIGSGLVEEINKFQEGINDEV